MRRATPATEKNTSSPKQIRKTVQTWIMVFINLSFGVKETA